MEDLAEEKACMLTLKHAVWAQYLSRKANAFLPPAASENSQSNNEDDLKIVRSKK